MNTNNLINAARFYLRQVRRLERAGLDAQDELLEAVIWEYAPQAADRLEHLQQSQPIPIPVKRRRDNFRRTGYDWEDE